MLKNTLPAKHSLLALPEVEKDPAACRARSFAIYWKQPTHIDPRPGEVFECRDRAIQSFLDVEKNGSR